MSISDPQGRAATADSIRKIHQTRPVNMLAKRAADRPRDESENERIAKAVATGLRAAGVVPMRKLGVDAHAGDDALNAIRKAHASGGRKLNPDSFLRRAPVIERNRDTSVAAIRKALSKPPQSANGVNDSTTASTGATGSFRDQAAPTARATVVGNQQIGVPSRTDRDAAVDAIKSIHRDGPKRDL